MKAGLKELVKAGKLFPSEALKKLKARDKDGFAVKSKTYRWFQTKADN